MARRGFLWRGRNESAVTVRNGSKRAHAVEARLSHDRSGIESRKSLQRKHLGILGYGDMRLTLPRS
jgi:hypothetical protein